MHSSETLMWMIWPSGKRKVTKKVLFYTQKAGKVFKKHTRRAFKYKTENSQQYLSCLMTKIIKWHVRPAMTDQPGHPPRLIWSESLLSAQWVAQDLRFFHADSKDSDPPSLIWVCGGSTGHFVGFVMIQLNTVRILLQILYELEHNKTNKVTCAPSEDSYQLGHLPSLISLAIWPKKVWLLC